jgi:hypothetical protein
VKNNQTAMPLNAEVAGCLNLTEKNIDKFSQTDT